MSSQEEVEHAVAGARQTSLPIVFTMSFDTNGRTMMGVGAADMMALHHRLGVHACGTNCGIGASEVVAAIMNFQASKTEGSDPVLVAKANCGIPEFIDGEIHYNGTPEIMASYARWHAMPGRASSVAVAALRPNTSLPCARRLTKRRPDPHQRSRMWSVSSGKSAVAHRPRPMANTK